MPRTRKTSGMSGFKIAYQALDDLRMGTFLDFEPDCPTLPTLRHLRVYGLEQRLAGFFFLQIKIAVGVMRKGADAGCRNRDTASARSWR